MTKDKEKQEIFHALLEKKRQQHADLSGFQEDQLESVNKADLDQSSMVENQRETMMRETRIENKSLDHLQREIEYLLGFEAYHEQEEVAPATVVKTNIGNFLVAVPEPEFEAGGEKFAGISTRSPIYQAMEGKKSGDKFDFNGNTIEIKEVF